MRPLVEYPKGHRWKWVVLALTPIACAFVLIPCGVWGWVFLAIIAGACWRTDRLPTVRKHWQRGGYLQAAEETQRAYERKPPVVGYRWGDIVVPDDEWTHGCLCAATGGAKTLLLEPYLRSVLETLDMPDRRLLMNDPKTEFVSRICGMGFEPRESLFIINPFDERGMAWSIAKDIDGDPDRMREFANILFNDDNIKHSGGNPFFMKAPKDMLKADFMALHHAHGNDWTLLDAIEPLKRPEAFADLIGSCPATEHLVETWVDRGDMSAGLFATLETYFDPYESIAKRWQTQPQLSISEWLNSSGNVLLLGSQNEYRIPMNAINRAMLFRAVQLMCSKPKCDVRRTFVIIEELREAGIGLSEYLRTLVIFARDLGARFVTAFQDTGGLGNVMANRAEVEELLGQCGFKFIGKLTSGSTSRWASEQFGEADYLLESMSESIDAEGKVTTNTSMGVHREAVVLPSEFQNIPLPDPHSGVHGYVITPRGSHRMFLEAQKIEQFKIAHSTLPKHANFVPAMAQDVDLQRAAMMTKHPSGRRRKIKLFTGNRKDSAS